MARVLLVNLVGTDSAHKKTHAMLCQEYLLQSDKVIYRIRPQGRKASCSPACRRREPSFGFTRTRCCCGLEDLDDQGTRISRGFDDPTAEQGVRRKHLTQIGLGLKTRPRSRILWGHFLRIQAPLASSTSALSPSPPTSSLAPLFLLRFNDRPVLYPLLQGDANRVSNVFPDCLARICFYREHVNA